MKWLQKLGDEILDICFPPSTLEASVRRMNYAELALHLRADTVPILDNAVALFPYQNHLVRQAVWELKYRGNRRIARLFAEALADYLLDELADSAQLDHTIPTLVPIPLSTTRRRKRGWNQVELVTKELLKLMPAGTVLYDTQLLVRTKNTESQTKMQSKSAREENLRGAFVLAENAAIPAGLIILLDDVITTGATLRSAQATLLEAGATKIQCIGLAH